MINSIEYKLHPEAFTLMKQAAKSIIDNTEREHKPNYISDLVFIHLFLYARRVGKDQEHIEFLTSVLKMDSLSITDLLGAIDKYQKELGL